MTDAGHRRTVALLGAALVATPVLLGVAYAAAGAVGMTGVAATGFSLGRLSHVLAEHTVWRSVFWSIVVAAVATALSVTAAACAATMFSGRRIVDRIARALAVAPLAVPYVVAGALGLLILGQSGFLARLAYAWGFIASPNDMPAVVYDTRGVGVILTLAWKEFPFLALVAFSLIAARGAALEETAHTLGAGRWATLSRVTWPLLWRGLLPAATAVFIFSMGNYEAAALLAPSDPLPLPMLTLERYDALELSQRTDAYVLTLLGLLIAIVAVGVHEWTRRRAELIDR
ncbi:MAG: ABC transporter permease subunit [Gemmatimonadaceae bacterium]